MTVRTLLNKLQVKLQLASQDRMMTPIYAVSMRELSDECRRVMEQMELFGTDVSLGCHNGKVFDGF